MNSFPHSCRAAVGTRPHLELGASVFSSGLPTRVRVAVGQSGLSRKAAGCLKNWAKACYSEVLTIVIFIKLVAL